MASQETENYKIWAADNVVYGPVDLAILSTWIREDRVTSNTWIFVESKDRWLKAAEIAELRDFFKASSPAPDTGTAIYLNPNATTVDIKPGALRRIKILGNLDDSQLNRFKKYLETHSVRQFTPIVKQGDPGDAMFFVMEGEVRVSLMISGKERILATLPAGDFFGEFCLFDHGARSADVVANADSVLLRMSASSFQQLLAEQPELAAPFLTSVGKSMAARIRADNKRYRETINIAQSRQ
jgi:hypothetical protein